MTRVLVVDDEPQILRTLSLNLRARRYDVLAVADGGEALDQAAGWHPDLVILDLGLPDPDGIRVIEGLRGGPYLRVYLDAMASVAYGPEAIVIVLAVAGGTGLGFTVPVTLAIALLLGVLTISYRQVIAAFPEGGGAYGVSRTYLGWTASLVAAASLVVDYVLNVAVSIAAGVAALTSAAPDLYPYRVWLCLGILVLITGINLRGIAESARAFIAPTAGFVVSILVVIVAGLFRDHAAAVNPHEAGSLKAVGFLLLLRAFANGCAALTGVEAIANAVPSFRKPRVKRAQRAEVVLGALLAVMLIGIAVLIERFSIRPVSGVTVLSQVTDASVGHGFLYYLVQGFLFATSALLLVAAGGDMNTLVPLFAIGVFVGFTLSQAGMVRHWWTDRPPGWRGRAAINGLGAVLTGIAAIVVNITKFTEGGWLIVVTIPLLVWLMSRINKAYVRIGATLGIGEIPALPRPRRALVIVPVGGVNRLTREALAAAPSLGDRVVAVRVVHPDDLEANREFVDAWEAWDPGVELDLINDDHRRLVEPVVRYVREAPERHVFVLIPEVEPEHLWQRLLQNQRGASLPTPSAATPQPSSAASASA